MPIIKSAIKKQRQDKVRKARNKKVETGFKDAIKAVGKTPKLETLKKAFSAIDRASKKRIIHKKKAARLKSNVARLVKGAK
jgi:ribosomal protein S20